MTEEPRRPAAGQEQLDAWLVLTGQAAPAAPTLRLPLLTGSMLPALPPGSTLVIDPRPDGRFGRGDVVVYARGERLVAHRVLLRLRLPGLDLIFEKGDANPRGRWLPARRVRGVVRQVVPPQGAGRDPADSAAAARSLRHHLGNLWRPRRPADGGNGP